MLTDYEKGCLDAWGTMQELMKQPYDMLKAIAPKSAHKENVKAIFSSINYGEAKEMVSKLTPKDGDEIRITVPGTNKTRLGYVAYVLNPYQIKVFIPDTLEFVTWTFPNTDLVKTGRNKKELMDQMWEVIEQLCKEEKDDSAGITGT